MVPLLRDEEEAMGPVERVLQSLMMGSPSRKVADCAATALGQLASLATGDLIGAADSADIRIKSRALRVLALSSDARAVEFMAARIDDADAGVRRQALIAGAQNRHHQRARAIQRALQDPNAETRGLALTFIDAKDEPWGFPATLQAAGDPDAGVRGLAADRLGALGDARAIDTLIDRLSDADPGVRQRAHNSLRLLAHTDRGADPAAGKQWRAQQRGHAPHRPARRRMVS
jgi:HEAT repeat protein